jgi:hypothetical protein
MSNRHVDWREERAKEATLTFPLDPDGERVFSAYAVANKDGTMTAHLAASTARGLASAGVPLTALADRSHHESGDYDGFLDDGHYRHCGLDDLDLEQTERLVRWAQCELNGYRTPPSGPRLRPSLLAS